MCGRYALALTPFEVRAYLSADNMEVDEAPEDVGDHAPEPSYNIAPGHLSLVYRAYALDQTTTVLARPGYTHNRRHEIRHKLQIMKWGLVPSWTQQNPHYGSILKAINCRDESLWEPTGKWTSIKSKKRCVVLAQGFYEWLRRGKEKIPYFVKRKDEKLMCFAGLFDFVQPEGERFRNIISSQISANMAAGEEEKRYTYTIITTDSNEQLRFLHNRMPAILENGSEGLQTWLNCKQSYWSEKLQSLLKPFDSELEVYPVSKEVGKVDKNYPRFIIPIASSENRSNIANFFGRSTSHGNCLPTATTQISDYQGSNTGPDGSQLEFTKVTVPEHQDTICHARTAQGLLVATSTDVASGIKRECDIAEHKLPKLKVLKTSDNGFPNTTLQKSVHRSSAARKHTAQRQESRRTCGGSHNITHYFRCPGSE